MKKQEHYRAVICIMLGFWLVYVYFRVLLSHGARLTPEQITCVVVVILAGVTLLVNNRKYEVFGKVVAVPFIAALWAFAWTLSSQRDFLGMIYYGLVALLFYVWFVFKRTSGKDAEKTKGGA